MTRIELSGENVQIDADVLARAFEISTDELQQRMREGTITSRFEHGQDTDSGKLRLVFFSADRRIRIIADASGKVLNCSAMDFAKPAAPASRQEAQSDENAVEGTSADHVASSRTNEEAIAEKDASRRRDRLETLLDEALDESFPASDPIAVSVDVSIRPINDSGEKP